VLEADVATAAEAVRFLLANWPELEAHMNDQHYRVSVGKYDLDLEELHHPAGAAPISFVPVVSGAGAVGRIIAGVALIALAFASGAGFFGAAFAKNIGLFAFAKGIGASLALGGVAQLLTPMPTVPQGADTQDDPRKSRTAFSGIQNTSHDKVFRSQSCYGETVVGSVVISAGIDTVQVVA
jgi:predicted phage tail protein